MKKVISLILCFTLMLSCSSLTSFAVNTLEIRCGDVECSPGDKVEVPIILSNNPGFAYLSITPNHSSELKTATIKNGSLISDLTKGKQYVWVSEEDMSENGVLATLTFNIGEDVALGEYKTSFIVRMCGNYDEESVKTTVIDGKVIVKAKASQKRAITISSATAAPSEEVSLDVVISGNPGINTFALGFDYDKTRLKLQDVTVADALGGQFAFSKKAVWISGKDSTYNGTILTATFKVLESAQNGDATVAVTYSSGEISNYNEDDVDFELESGKITVKGSVCPPHNYEDTVILPTCLTEGYTTHVCKLCGESYIDGYVEALGHSFTNYISDKNATCTEDGTKTAKCDRCDVTDTVTEKGSKLGHKYDEWIHVDGTKTHKRVCKNDSTHTETNTCEFTSKVTKKATCTESGTKTFACSVCGYSYDESIPAVGHKDSDNNGICDVCNKNICKHENAKHVDEVKANCAATGNIEYYHCEKCGLYATDSKFEKIIDKFATVTAKDSENHIGKTEVRDSSAATCEKDGYTGDTYCLGCNAKIAVGKKIDKLGHSFTNYISDKNATCTKDGTKTAKCDRCGKTNTIVDDNSMVAHTIIIDEAVAATCKNSGLTEGMHCLVCGKVIVEQKKIEKLSHDFEMVKVVTATCTEDGYTIYECKMCGEQEHRDVIEAAGHDDSDKDGVCDVCGNKISTIQDSFKEFLHLIVMLLILVFKFLMMLAGA